MGKKSLVGSIVLGLSAGLFFFHARASSRGPDSLLLYRQPLAQLSLEVQIAAMEKRVASAPAPSAMDLGALAGLYVDAAKRSGNAFWWDKAADAVRRSLAVLPAAENPGAEGVQAQIDMAEHDFSRAIAIADAMSHTARGETQARSIRATAELAIGRLADAERDADALVSRRPMLSSYTQRGLVYEAMGRDDEAMEDWLSGLLVEDIGEIAESAWTRTLIARNHFRHGRLPQAQAWLDEALRLVPGQPVALGLAGDLAARRGDVKLAVSRYEEALLASGDPSYLVREGRALEAAGEHDRAERAWSEAEKLLRLQLKDGKTGHRAELARVLLTRGRASDAPEALSIMQTEADRRRGADTLTLLAWSLGANGRWSDARAAIREALDEGARTAELYARASWVERGAGDAGRAAFYRNESLAVDPTYPGP